MCESFAMLVFLKAFSFVLTDLIQATSGTMCPTMILVPRFSRNSVSLRPSFTLGIPLLDLTATAWGGRPKSALAFLVYSPALAKMYYLL